MKRRKVLIEINLVEENAEAVKEEIDKDTRGVLKAELCHSLIGKR